LLKREEERRYNYIYIVISLKINMETLEDLKRQLAKETSYEINKKEMRDLGVQRANLKSQIKAKRFARERPKTSRFFKGLVAASSVAGRGIQKAAGEVQKREGARKKSGGKKKARYNLYGERMD
jgi:hypothetical protein